MSSEGAEGAEPAMDTGDEPMTKVPGGCRLLRRRRGRQKNELRIRCLTSADQARRLPIPVEFTPRLNKRAVVAPSDSATGMAPGDPFRIPSASASDRSLPRAPPKSWAWRVQANGTRMGPPTLGDLRRFAKRPRRRRRERLQGFKTTNTKLTKPHPRHSEGDTTNEDWVTVVRSELLNAT